MIDVSLNRTTARWQGLTPISIFWWAATALCLICLVFASHVPALTIFPQQWTVPIAAWVNAVTGPVFSTLQPAFRGLSALLSWPLFSLQALLQWLPWPALSAGLILVAARAGGWKLASFSILTCLYILATGYWQPSMNTLAMIFFAVPLSVVIGFYLGVLSFRAPRWRSAIETCLDLMQTVPAFAYLIPLLLLFGFGPVVGLISSAIYAIPPMVRNTCLGLELVAAETREAGIMSGSNSRQLFWLVEIPCALPQLLVGLNQTTMAAFSMVIIASIIGGFADIGWAVLDAMRKAEFGESLLSGGVIALMAMVMDRVTHGFSRKPDDRSTGATTFAGKGYWLALTGVVTFAVLSHIFAPADSLWLQAPSAWFNADGLNSVILALVQRYSDLIDAVKNGVFYALLLPLRLGVAGAATPYVWGFTLTPLLATLYWGVIAGLAFGCLRLLSWGTAVVVVLAGAILYSGFSALPWPILPILFVSLAAQVGGWRLAAFVGGSLAFMLLTGIWSPLMQSLYLCGLAIFFSVIIGGSLGLWAAHSNRVSIVLRAVCDALQTMPQFVFLIPVLMFFKVGEFTALIAIMLYSVVPPIRYGEHALRSVPTGLVEAGMQMGCSGQQMLWLVKLPSAMPILMLGINQTIMAALSMLVIAAMVGTRDLGQQVYIALGKADAGLGLVSGLAIALLAMMSDRLIRSWVTRRQVSLSV